MSNQQVPPSQDFLVLTCLMAGAIAQIVLCVKNTQKRDLHAADANQLFILLVVRFVWRVAQTQELMLERLDAACLNAPRNI